MRRPAGRRGTGCGRQACGNGVMQQITDHEFHALVDMVKSAYGIDLGKKRALVESRLAYHLDENGYTSYGAYLDVIQRSGPSAELTELLNRLTTNHTFFMREPEHFRHFSGRVLPEIAEVARDRDIRVWSAGCSSGQEPYTLYMLMSEFFERIPGRWDYRVLATDISERALLAARTGTYEGAEVDTLPEAWKRRWFRRNADGTATATDELRSGVFFRPFNLMESVFPFRKAFHVIFCRNVMIYFDGETKRSLVDRFCGSTMTGGYLYIGQTESVGKGDGRYRYIQPAVYRRER